MGKTLPRPRSTAPVPPTPGTVPARSRLSSRKPALVRPSLASTEPAPAAFEPTGCEEIDALLAKQGRITEQEYLDLPPARLVEYSDGRIEVHPVPIVNHQRIAQLLFRMLTAYVESRRLGEVFIAPMPMTVRTRGYREPDVLFVAAGKVLSGTESRVPAADLVMEVVSSGAESQRRDLVTKRAEYAGAGIAEYWIVDPDARRITVLRLDGGKYVVHSTAGIRGTAKSALLPGFTVRPADVLPGK